MNLRGEFGVYDSFDSSLVANTFSAGKTGQIMTTHVQYLNKYNKVISTFQTDGCTTITGEGNLFVESSLCPFNKCFVDFVVF